MGIVESKGKGEILRESYRQAIVEAEFRRQKQTNELTIDGSNR